MAVVAVVAAAAGEDLQSLLGTLLEYRLRQLLLAASRTGILFVSALLMTPYPKLEYYCGLSGVLNTLLLVALWLQWNLTRSWWVIILVCGSISKVLVKVSQGMSIVTHISWPPYPWSHLAGLSGGLFIIWIQSRGFQNKTPCPALKST